MDWQERITADPEVLGGKPRIRGTRISVALILEYLAAEWSVERILASYPHISREDVLACLAYASQTMDHRITETPRVA